MEENEHDSSNAYIYFPRSDVVGKKSSLSSSFSYTSVEDDDFDEIILPPPKERSFRQRVPETSASDSTPLVPRMRQKRQVPGRSNLVFGSQDIFWQNDLSSAVGGTEEVKKDGRTSPRGVASFLFGFMYEEPHPDDHVPLRGSSETDLRPVKLALCANLMLTSAAAAVPITLLPVIGQTWSSGATDVSPFISRAAASAVLGLAVGKFMNGPLGDILGARRVSIAYSLLLSISLLFLSVSWNEWATLWASFFVEFAQSVQWPVTVIILASHAGGHLFERGIYATSLSSRFGALLSTPVSSLLLRHYNWRIVSAMTSVVSLLASWVAYRFSRDSPFKVHDPQNPIAPSTIDEATASARSETGLALAPFRIASGVFMANVLPSLCSVMKSPTFWVVAISHAGDAMARSSERALCPYYLATSDGALMETRASGLAVVLPFGIVAGMAIAGNIFTASSPRERKKLITRLYILAIVCCYSLACLAIPRVRGFFGETGLVLSFQLIATFFMGFGTAVQSYVPGIIGASFGRNKGLFSAYTDGIAYGLSSVVWRIVGGAVGGQESSIGWAYGWAAVALLVVVCAILMLEFFEFYFVRRNKITAGNAGYETIIFV